MPARARSPKPLPARTRPHSAPAFRPPFRESRPGTLSRPSAPWPAARIVPIFARAAARNYAPVPLGALRIATCSAKPSNPASAISTLLPPPSTNSGKPCSRAHAHASAISASLAASTNHRAGPRYRGSSAGQAQCSSRIFKDQDYTQPRVIRECAPLHRCAERIDSASSLATRSNP